MYQFYNNSLKLFLNIELDYIVIISYFNFSEYTKKKKIFITRVDLYQNQKIIK